MGTLLLALAILFNSAANVLFKAGSTVGDHPPRKLLLLGLGLLLGLANTLCYMKSLETLRLGVAYAVFAASSTVLIVLLSFAFFEEGISAQKAAGIIVICAGLFLLRGS